MPARSEEFRKSQRSFEELWKALMNSEGQERITKGQDNTRQSLGKVEQGAGAQEARTARDHKKPSHGQSRHDRSGVAVKTLKSHGRSHHDSSDNSSRSLDFVSQLLLSRTRMPVRPALAQKNGTMHTVAFTRTPTLTRTGTPTCTRTCPRPRTQMFTHTL